jgi:Ca2+-binding RTX toxin-like protein
LDPTFLSHNIITLGNGAGDAVSALGIGFVSNNTQYFWGAYNTITLGNSSQDSVVASGNNDIITLGNGNHDTFTGSDALNDPNSGSTNTVILGNGDGDVVNDGYDGGNNTITAGNGAGDSVITGFSRVDTITLGNGAGDLVSVNGTLHDTITLGNGAGDLVTGNFGVGGTANFNASTIKLRNGDGDTVNTNGLRSTIILGNGDGDVVNDGNGGGSNTITVGNGNDTIYVGDGDTVTVGTGHDSFVFQRALPGSIGAVSINHFDPSKDVIQINSALATSVTPVDDGHGNTVITVDNAGDTITLVGVHASVLHSSDFSFVA